MKRKILTSLLSCAMVASMVTPVALAADVPSSWAADGVNQAIGANLVPAALQKSYDQGITRAQFCALGVALYESVTATPITESQTFTDTTDVNVQKMAGLGIVTGGGDGTFNPDGPLTREQAATILARLSEKLGKPLEAATATFADSGEISTWAAAAVGQMQTSGIMGGVGDNKFAPAGAYTVEQSILTTLRVSETVSEATPAPQGEPTYLVLYEDDMMKVEYYKMEKSARKEANVELYLDVTNKSADTLTLCTDTLSFNGWATSKVTMWNQVSGDSVGTVNATIEDYPFDKVPLDSVKTLGGQFLRKNETTADYDNPVFMSHDLYTGETVTTLPTVEGKTPLYSDDNVDIYYNDAEYYEYNDANERIDLSLLVANKTDKTLLIQNDTVTIDGRSYDNTIMSHPVLPYTVGYVTTAVKDTERAPDPSTITTIGGQYRIINDTDYSDSYTAILN